MWTLYHDVQNNPIKDYVTILDMVGPDDGPRKCL